MPQKPAGSRASCQRRSMLHRMCAETLGRDRCGMRLLPEGGRDGGRESEGQIESLSARAAWNRVEGRKEEERREAAPAEDTRAIWITDPCTLRTALSPRGPRRCPRRIRRGSPSPAVRRRRPGPSPHTRYRQRSTYAGPSVPIDGPAASLASSRWRR